MNLYDLVRNTQEKLSASFTATLGGLTKTLQPLDQNINKIFKCDSLKLEECKRLVLLKQESKNILLTKLNEGGLLIRCYRILSNTLQIAEIEETALWVLPALL